MFIGYNKPFLHEREHRCGRTEIYYCENCGSLTRFARYNRILKIFQTGKGRCGEYSQVMLRTLMVLGFECRWVVDYADHIWAEVSLGEDKHIHLDACEQAVDDNLLYQGWGKKQNLIVAFGKRGVEDVTRHYTSDEFSEIRSRREKENWDLERGGGGYGDGDGEGDDNEAIIRNAISEAGQYLRGVLD